jgi:signal transduction histidine kinase
VTLTPARRAAAVAAGAAAVLLLGLLTYLTTARTRESAVWVSHTYEVLGALEAAQGRTVDAETGVRGYAATGVARFLEPYVRAERDVAHEVARLRRLTVDNAGQQPRLDTLEARLAGVFDHLDSAVTLTRARLPQGTEVAALLAAGKARMDAARAAAMAVSAEERRLLAQREKDDRRLVAATGWVVFGETLAAASCVVVVGLLLASAARAQQRHAAAEHEARVAAEQARGEAEEAALQLQEQAASLEALNTELLEQAATLAERTSDAQRQREEAERQREEAERHQADAEQHRAAAERANRARADFLASMSHELRTPLNAIQGYVQLLEDGIYGSLADQQRAALGRVARAQRHLLALVTDVLNFARLEEGRVTFDLRETRVADVLRDVVPLVEPQLAAKGLTLDVVVPDGPGSDGPGEPGAAAASDPGLVWADHEKLGQVLLNLLSNAVKFTPSVGPDGTPGRVTVALVVAPDAPGLAFVEVRDTGIGIPADKLAAIFDPFVQVSTGLTRTSEGTGLGLAISRDLARGMGADLRVRSTEGVGSTFTVKLRRVVDAAGQPTDRRRQDERRTDRG